MAKCPKCHFEYRKGGLCWCNTEGTPSFINDIPEHFNRGLGEVVTGRRDYKQKLKERNLIEVGNDRKMVDPDENRKKLERQFEKDLVAVRPQAYEMLSHYEGRPQWNE